MLFVDLGDDLAGKEGHNRDGTDRNTVITQ